MKKPYIMSDVFFGLHNSPLTLCGSSVFLAFIYDDGGNFFGFFSFFKLCWRGEEEEEEEEVIFIYFLAHKVEFDLTWDPIIQTKYASKEL
jgi:hypothetical protein